MLKNKIFKETIISYANQFIVLIFWLALIILLPKYFWIWNYWLFTLILSYISLMWIFFWASIQEWVKKEITENKDNVNKKNISQIISNWFYLKLILSFLFIIILYIISNLFNIEVLLNNFWLFYLLVICMNLWWLIINSFMALHKNIYIFYMYLLEYITKAVLFIYFYIIWFTSLEAILMAFIIWYLLALIVWFILLFFKNKIYLSKFDMNISKTLFSRYIYLSFFAIWFLLLTKIDNIMISYFFNENMLWYYNIATNLVNNSTILTVALIIWVLPAFNLKEHNFNKIKRLFKKYFHLLLSINIFLSISIFLLSWFIINLVYGEWYELTITIMQIIFLFPLFASLQSFFSKILNNFWDYKILMYSSLFIAILNIWLNLFLIQLVWIIWIWIATITSFFVWTLFLGIVVYKRIWSFKK